MPRIKNNFRRPQLTRPLKVFHRLPVKSKFQMRLEAAEKAAAAAAVRKYQAQRQLAKVVARFRGKKVRKDFRGNARGYLTGGRFTRSK